MPRSFQVGSSSEGSEAVSVVLFSLDLKQFTYFEWLKTMTGLIWLCLLGQKQDRASNGDFLASETLNANSKQFSYGAVLCEAGQKFG